MTALIASDTVSLIVGGGNTGLSVARYFEKQKKHYRIYDTRDEASIFDEFRSLNSAVECFSGEFREHYLKGVNEIVLSPGVSRAEPLIQNALEQGITVKSDIKLFLEQVEVPVVGITGSNGKSTVTTMLGLAAEAARIKVAVGGNLGVPALDLIGDGVELYVLELSSFQLESTENASLDVAVNLNLSPDHLDRHGSMTAYFQAKQKIFHQAKNVVYNLNDALTQPPLVAGVNRFGFSIDENIEKREKQFYFNNQEGVLECDKDVLLSVDAIKQPGLHNIENVLALFAIAYAVGIDASAVTNVAKSFSGLPHRCEYIGAIDGVAYINDSKATNTGATCAAIKGLAVDNQPVVLIAGGEGKGADFNELGNIIATHIKAAVLIGKDADLIEKCIKQRVKCSKASSLKDAVELVGDLAENGDIVLFSPACASFDMFKNFEARGEVFRSIVLEAAA